MLRKENIPTYITWSRILAVPALLPLLYMQTVEYNIAAAILFSLASLTDYLDGYYARRWNVVSKMGQIMDPIADKILVSGTLIFLTYFQKVDPLMVVILMTRDTLIGGVRSVAAAEGLVIPANTTGKWKTALQMICIPFVILGDIAGMNISPLGQGILWITVVLSITSAFDYFRGYRLVMNSKKSQ